MLTLFPLHLPLSSKSHLKSITDDMLIQLLIVFAINMIAFPCGNLSMLAGIRRLYSLLSILFINMLFFFIGCPFLFEDVWSDGQMPCCKAQINTSRDYSKPDNNDDELDSRGIL